MTINEKLEKLGYEYHFNRDNSKVYIRTFGISFLYILMRKDKVYDYYTAVDGAICSEYDLEAVTLAYKELQKDVEELKKMTKEKLKELCKLCEKEDIEKGYLGCPFRHISSDYCRLYELIEEELEKED